MGLEGYSTRKEGYRKGDIRDWRDSRLEGYRNGGMQDRWDTGREGSGKEECRKGEMKEKEGSRKVWVRERRDSRDEVCKFGSEMALIKKEDSLKGTVFCFVSIRFAC